MKPSANNIEWGDGRSGDVIQNAIRRYAITRDWHRLRDQDAEWRLFQRIVTRVVVVIAALFVIGTLTGCDTPAKQCARWDAKVIGYELCAADSGCRMKIRNYAELTDARIERARWCPKEKL